MAPTAPPDPLLDNRLLTPKQAAAYCGVSCATIYRWISERRFAVIHLPRLVRIRMSDLEAYLRGNTTRAIAL